jgi:hypothetical protein
MAARKPPIKDTAVIEPKPSNIRKRGENGQAEPILSDEVRAKFLDALLAGAYTETAITFAGVSRASFFRWISTGQTIRDRLVIDETYEPTPHEAQCLELLDTVEQSRAAAEVAAIGVIRRAAREGTWQAAAWWLERTMPRKYGRFDREEDMASSGAEGRTVTVSLEELEQAVQDVKAQRAKQSR